MSFYKDIYNDYPLRCAEVWEICNDAAIEKKRDVTLMLMCAAGGFATPWEHLKIQPGQAKSNNGHPAFFGYDVKKYERCLKVLETALQRNVEDSRLFENVKLDNCFYGHAKSIDLILDMAECRLPSVLDFAKQPARAIVKALRNAIAHNNIYAFARDRENEISDLAFFSEVVDKSKKQTKVVEHYEVIVMSSEDFSSFLTAWFGLLRQADQRGSHLKLVVSNALEDDDEPTAAVG